MLTNNLSKAIFNGNGVATEFPFSFRVWDISQLLVSVIDTHGMEASTTSFSLMLSDNGGTINYLHEGNPLPEGYKLVVLRNMPFTQNIDLITGTRFDPHVIEEALDKATAERQQLQEAMERSVKIEPTSHFTADELLQQIFTAQAESIKSAHVASENAFKAEQEASNIQAQVQNYVNIATQQADRAEAEANKVSSTLGTPDGVTIVKNASNQFYVQTTSLSHVTAENGTHPARVDELKAAHEAIASVQAMASSAQTRADEAYERIEENSSKAHIVETWKATNGSSWYRKWSDGFIEQGMYFSSLSFGSSNGYGKYATITLPLAFSTRTFTIVINSNASDYGSGYANYDVIGISSSNNTLRAVRMAAAANTALTVYCAGY